MKNKHLYFYLTVAMLNYMVPACVAQSAKTLICSVTNTSYTAILFDEKKPFPPSENRPAAPVITNTHSISLVVSNTALKTSEVLWHFEFVEYLKSQLPTFKCFDMILVETNLHLLCQNYSSIVLKTIPIEQASNPRRPVTTLDLFRESPANGNVVTFAKFLVTNNIPQIKLEITGMPTRWWTFKADNQIWLNDNQLNSTRQP